MKSSRGILSFKVPPHKKSQGWMGWMGGGWGWIGGPMGWGRGGPGAVLGGPTVPRVSMR